MWKIRAQYKWHYSHSAKINVLNVVNTNSWKPKISIFMIIDNSWGWLSQSFIFLRKVWSAIVQKIRFFTVFGWEKMIEPTFFASKLTIILILSSQFLCNKVKNQLEKSLRLLKRRFLQRHFLAKNIYPSLWSRSEEDLHEKYRTFGKSSYCKDE